MVDRAPEKGKTAQREDASEAKNGKRINKHISIISIFFHEPEQQGKFSRIENQDWEVKRSHNETQNPH